MARIFALTVLGGAGLLALAVWPGVLEDAAFGLPFVCLSLPLLGFWFLMLVCLAARELVGTATSPTSHRRRGCWSALIMFVTLGLLWFHVPQRIAFGLCCSELQELTAAAPANERRGAELGRQIGPYWVDRYSADRRGGVFFRTYRCTEGIGPDELSYGFAFQPNGKGTPFGNASYRHRHLFGDWYVFAASDDF